MLELRNAHEAAAQDGEEIGYTRLEIEKKLECGRVFVESFADGVNALGGAAVLPFTGRCNGRNVNRWPKGPINEIEAVFMAAKQGRVVIKRVAWLNAARLTKRLRTERSGKRTPARGGRSCPRLSRDGSPFVYTWGRIEHKQMRLSGKGVAPDWFLEADVERIAKALAEVAKGVYIDSDQPHKAPRFTTTRGAAELSNAAPRQSATGVIAASSKASRLGTGGAPAPGG